jgi:hypothetical protein
VETFAVESDSLTDSTLSEGDHLMDSAHVSALNSKHANFDRRIAEETSRPRPDNALISMLKKQKLKVKEALARL